MATNRDKLIAVAQKLAEKGQFERAIKEYQRVIAEFGADVRIRLKIGDLFARLGRSRETAEAYLDVAQAYCDQGRHDKAIAVYKQILKIEPRMILVNQRLAELYKQMGLIPDAIEQYETVSSFFLREGKAQDALEPMREMAELDPENIASRIKLAELYSREQLVREAVREFAGAAEFLHDHDRFDDYLKVAERLLFHQPDNRPVARELARQYIARGDARRALPKLQVCLKTDARDLEALSLLAQAFEALEQESKSISVLKEIAHIHHERGDADARDAAYREVVRLVPEDGEARKALARAAASAEDSSPSSSQESLSTGTPAPESSRPVFLDGLADAASPEVAHEEEIGQILTETDVFMKYGLNAKALEHLQRVFDLSPEHIDARRKLKSLYLAMGRVDEAVAVLLSLAEQEEPRRHEYLQEVLELQPDHASARRLLDPSLEEVVELDDISGLLEVEESELEAADVVQALDEESILEEEDETTSGPAEVEVLLEVTSDAPEPRLANPEGGDAEDVGIEELIGGTLEDDLEEAEFFAQQNMREEARDLLQGLLRRYPDHPLVAAKLQELDAAGFIATSAIPEGSGAPEAAGAEISLREDSGMTPVAQLAAMGEVMPIAVESTSVGIVDDLVHGLVVDNEITPEDFDTHFDLGMAYKEMGLFDDAIAEFEAARRDPKREVQCHLLLGLCSIEKGTSTEAIRHFKDGLYVEQITEQEQLGLYCEIGQAYELLSDAREALYYYEKVFKRDPRFRDVERRIAILRGEAPVPSIDEGGEVEVEAAFDGIMAPDGSGDGH